MKLVAASISVVSFTIILICLIKMGKLKSVKYKELEVKIGSNEKGSDYSLINRYIDEVLYFFECINVDLVIFEDLDRFDNLKIFVKLRELNTIINNSPKRAKKVTFIYAVKDDMFADEKQRAKFFEFILPVIPVVNPLTTSDNIRAINNTLVDENNPLFLSEQFIKDVSYFVTDMRVLKNTFNDYIIMANKLSDNSQHKFLLRRENLFALALYKNLYPYDYSRLQDKSGLIPLCVDKDVLVKQFTAHAKEEIDRLENQKKSIDNEILQHFEELKLIFKGQHFRDNAVSYFPGVKNVDKIDTFNGITILEHPNRSGYSVVIKRLPDGQTYYAREKFIKDKFERQNLIIEDKIRQLLKEIENIENSTFHSLIEKIGMEEYFSQERLNEIKNNYKEIVANDIFVDGINDDLPIDKYDAIFDKQVDLVTMLIHKGYIDEDYMEYISTYKSELSVNDRNFIRNVKKGFCKSSNYHLDDVRAVIRELNEEDFLQNAIIVNDVCRSLDLIKDEDMLYEVKTSKYKKLMQLFNLCKDATVQSVLAFLAVAEDKEKIAFAEHIIDNALIFVERLFTSSMSVKDKDIFSNIIIKKQKDVSSLEEIKQYISGHEHYTSIMKNIDTEHICKYLDEQRFIFEKLDLSTDKDAVYEHIVANDYYALSIANLKVVLDVEDENFEQFEKKNYTYIIQSNNDILKERIGNNINEYIENVYMQLTKLSESEAIVESFLVNESIKEENKIGIISNTEFRVSNLNNINSDFYKQLLIESRVVPTWDNILTAYKSFGFEESLKIFIKGVNGVISGSFSDLPDEFKDKLFNDILASDLEDGLLINLSDSIDAKYSLNGKYGANKNIAPFILSGCFRYNVSDLQFLQNPPSTIPYIITHQNNIKEEINKFFGNITLVPVTVRNVIEEPRICLDFKKELIKLYGDKFNIQGVEDIVARFLVANDCTIKEGLLYQFTDTTIDADVKIGLLSLAIKYGNINDLSKFKTFLCSIDDKFSDLFSKKKKIKMNDNSNNRLIVEFMKKQKLVTSFITRSAIIHVNCC